MADSAVEGARTSAAAVANVFLDLQEQDAAVSPLIDQMKLQKLVFYAHAWWLAFTDTPLFGDDIEAWPWGPVVRNVYSEFCDFKRDPIVGRRATELVRTGHGPRRFKLVEPQPPDSEVKRFLKSVWETHKHLTGVQLSNSTHAPGEPWTITKDEYGSLDSKPRIPNAVIRDVFKQKLEQRHT